MISPSCIYIYIYIIIIIPIVLVLTVHDTVSPYVTIVIILIVFYQIRSLDHVYHMSYPIISHEVTLYHIIHHNIHQSLVICSSWSPMIGYVIIFHYINISNQFTSLSHLCW